MGYDVFTRRDDLNPPIWSQSHALVDQILEGRGYLRPLFKAPVEIVDNKEIRRFSHNDPRLESAFSELDISLREYSPTNKFAGVIIEPPYPEEIIERAAFSLKQVIDYARQHEVELFIDG